MRVAFLLAWACLWALGCQAAEGPDLLVLREIGPVVVSAGDRVDVRGEGFPQGRRATVVFRGELRRPGSPAVEDVEISAAGFAHSASQVTLSIDEAIARRFVGSGAMAVHTTFHGDVRVIFAARAATAPAVVGTLRGLTFDVVTPEPGDLSQRHEEQGRQFIAHAGIVASHGGPQTPVAVTAVLPGGLADRTGLREGDLLASLAGVTVRSISDLAVPRGLRTAVLWVRRPGLSEPFRVELDVTPLSPPAMSDLAPAAVLLGIVVILAVLLLGPLPRLAAWFERGVWLGASGGAARRRLGAEHVLEWLSPSGQSGARDVAAPLLSFIAVISIFAYLGFGRSLVSPEADLGLIYAVSVVCLLAGRLVEGGLRRGTTWSLASGLLAVLQTLVAVVPGLIGMAALALAAESVTLHDIARAQGGAPWRWWGFDNPGLVVCAFALLLSAAPTGAENRDRFALLEGARSAHPSRLSSLFARGSEWLHAWITAALVVTLYFGAWQIPLVSAVWAPTLGTQAAGAALFVVKLWMAMLVIVAGRALAARVGVGALVGPFAMRLLPAALAFGAGAVVWAEAAARVELPPATVGALTLGVCFATALYLALRMRTASNRDPLAGSVNPWL